MKIVSFRPNITNIGLLEPHGYEASTHQILINFEHFFAKTWTHDGFSWFDEGWRKIDLLKSDHFFQKCMSRFLPRYDPRGYGHKTQNCVLRKWSYAFGFFAIWKSVELHSSPVISNSSSQIGSRTTHDYFSTIFDHLSYVSCTPPPLRSTFLIISPPSSSPIFFIEPLNARKIIRSPTCHYKISQSSW